MALISVITPSIRPQHLDLAQRCLEAQTNQDFEWHVEIGFPSRGFTLPSDWNKLLRRCRGGIVVLYQDCISIPADALERIAALDHTRTAYTYPVGKQQGERVQWEWRRHWQQVHGNELLPPHQWEIDLASAPIALFQDVGGFDEAFNDGWSWENVEIAWRAEQAGYRFSVSSATEGVALDHDALTEHPFRNKRENNDRRANETRMAAINGHWQLTYL